MLSTWLILIALLLSGCSEDSDEELIKAQIAAVQDAVERKAFTEIPDYLHHDFRANDAMGVKEVKQLLRMYGLQHQRIGVTVLNSEITMDEYSDARASTTLSVAVTGASGLLPSNASVRPVRVVWEKYDGDWLVIEAEWRRGRH